jgi:hypothetical protein
MRIAETQWRGNASHTNCVSHVANTPNATVALGDDVVSLYCWVQLKCDGTWWRREGKWRGNWRMGWVASTLHTTSERGVFSINTADAHTSAASSRLNRRPHRFKWTRPFRRKTKSGFCACAITFQTQSTCMTHAFKVTTEMYRRRRKLVYV